LSFLLHLLLPISSQIVLSHLIKESSFSISEGVILKLDFEKAYDKVKWSFLQQTLRMKCFSDEWCALINSFVSEDSVAIKVNDDIGLCFQTLKGLRHGDPLSSMLYNIVVDMFATIIERAKNDGLIEGVVPYLVDGGLSILPYTDVTILFMEHDLEKARNLKLILLAFEQLFGRKNNFYKSELFCFGEAHDKVNEYANLFGCGQGQFPMRYLRILIHYWRLTIAKWKGRRGKTAKTP
jgi:hypothetical protein